MQRSNNSCSRACAVAAGDGRDQVDTVSGASAPVVDGRFFSYVDPRADPQNDDRRLVAYDASGKVVTAEPASAPTPPSPSG